MSLLFTDNGQWIKPHINHILSSYTACTDLPSAVLDENGRLIDHISLNHIDTLIKNKDINLIHEALIKKSFDVRKGTLSFVFYDYITFIVAPLFLDSQYKGFMIAGPIFHSKEEYELAKYRPPVQADDHYYKLVNMAVIKSSSKVHYLSQLMYQSLHGSVTGSLHTNKTEHIKIEQDVNLNKNLKTIIQLKDLFASGNTKEVMHLYKKTMKHTSTNDIKTYHDVQVEMISLLALIYEHFIRSNSHSTYLEHYRYNFSHRIMNAQSVHALINIGECMIHRFSQLFSEKKYVGKSQLVRNTLDYLHDHFNKKIMIEDLCQLNFVSKAHLSAIFKEEMNMSIMNYLKDFRIKQSQLLLLGTRKPIADIAVICGFENANYYSNVFKSMHNISPSQYRKNEKAFRFN